MRLSAVLFSLALGLLAATQAEADFKDCLNISILAIEGQKVVVPINTEKMEKVEKWNSASSSWESVLLINNGKSRLLNSKFTDLFTVSQGDFIVKNMSREAQGVFRVTFYLSGKCVALIKLTVQEPTTFPSVIPGNQAPAAYPALWALLLIPIVAIIIVAVQRFCLRKDGSGASVSNIQPSGEEEGIQIRTERRKYKV